MKRISNSKKKKSILITGGKGFIGSNFLNYNKKVNKYINSEIISPTHRDLDISDLEKLKVFFEKNQPEVLINFAAHRNANTAEEQRGDIKGSVWKTNVTGVKNLSLLCKQYSTFLIHISTDMVFSGIEKNPGPYGEKAKTEADLKKLSWYGWTKAEAERTLADNKSKAIIRIGNVTAPIYDPTLDYVGKIVYLFDKKKLYPLFYDQFLTLTFIPSIFEAIEIIISQRKKGIFHIASTNVFTPYDLAKYIFKKMGNKQNSVQHVSINGYLKKFPNRYPKFGGLLEKETREKLRLKSLTWEEIVDKFCFEISQSKME